MPAWPSLPLAEWRDTCATLHLWMQIVGKVRLAQTAWINHSWHVTLYVTARGLTTSPIPYGQSTFEIDFDFVDHRLEVRSSDGRAAGFALEPMTVAAFYARLQERMAALDLLGRYLEHELALGELPSYCAGGAPSGTLAAIARPPREYHRG